ncbi:MAG TPA: DUF4230 domain-containing protein [Chthoniobacterales bacterium]|nr:DUF4230 domain-containing protein [Chthoniobacterales bacterium]
MNERHQPRRKSAWAVALTVMFLAALALLAFLFLRIESWPMRTAQQGTAELERLAGKVRDAFIDMAQLQPRVTVNDRVVMEQTTGVAELALVSRKMSVEHEFAHTWAGSTKRVKLQGTFVAKAGFDLRENVAVHVRDDAIAVQMPRASILGVEQEKVDVLEFENGYWNRISAADLENELAALPRLAREKAEQAALSEEAERALEQQLQQRFGSTKPVTLTFAPAQTAPKQ